MQSLGRDVLVSPGENFREKDGWNHMLTKCRSMISQSGNWSDRHAEVWVIGKKAILIWILMLARKIDINGFSMTQYAHYSE